MVRISDKEILKRLAELQALKAANANILTVESWINAGMYYDDLTDEQKEVYAAYYHTNRATLEDWAALVEKSNHFQLTAVPNVRTRNDLDELEKEIEALVNNGNLVS